MPVWLSLIATLTQDRTEMPLPILSTSGLPIKVKITAERSLHCVGSRKALERLGQEEWSQRQSNVIQKL